MPNLRHKAKIELPEDLSYGKAATILGCSRPHLWRVCMGERKASPELESRLKDLIKNNKLGLS